MLTFECHKSQKFREGNADFEGEFDIPHPRSAPKIG
jgi:hypothetical protein